MSRSSLEGSPGPQDLAAKYQKITSEYAKIRAQNHVLKKAVVDEQAHSAELKEKLKLKEVSLRKADQEIDSLNFRNQQLTKRVAVLQAELEDSQKSGKKDKNKGSSNEASNSVYAEDLASKIAENASLTTKLQEQAEKFEAEKFRFIQSQEKLEHELREYKNKLENLQRTKLSALESENRQLQLKLVSKEETVKRLNNELKVIRHYAHYRSMAFRREHWREKLVKFFQYIGVEDLLRHFIVLYECLRNNYLMSIDPVAGENYIQCIEANVRAVENLITSYGSYCVSILNGGDVSGGFNFVCPSIRKCVILLDDLNHYIVYCQDKEVNRLMKDLVMRLKSHWIQFLSAIELYVIYKKTPINKEEIASAFSDIFRALRSTCDFISSALTDARAAEKDPRNKDITSNLSSIGAQSSIIYKKVSENKIVILNSIYGNPRALIYKISHQESDCCQAWKEKLEKMNETYTKKVRDLEEQIACLLRASNRNGGNDNAAGPSGSHGDGNQDSGNRSPTDHRPLEASSGIEQRPSTQVPWQNPEAELAKYFNKRANTLIIDRQFAESKVTTLKTECDALQKRLENDRRSILSLEDTIKENQDTIARLQEELTTTTSNYETQLASLSEHIANMNDKLAAQQEEIDLLKHQLSEKNGNKQKSK